MNAATKLWKRLQDQGLIGRDPPPDPEVSRTHAGRHQRSAGAWSWTFSSASDWIVSCIGSEFTLGELLKSPFHSIFKSCGGDVSIYPEPSKPSQAIKGSF